MFDILHMVGNSLITLLRAGKILAMDHDSSARRKGMSSRKWSTQLEMWSSRVIIDGGHGFELSMKPSKSYSNRRYVNWSHHVV